MVNIGHPPSASLSLISRGKFEVKRGTVWPRTTPFCHHSAPRTHSILTDHGGSPSATMWNLSATMVEYVSHHGGSHQPPWWKPSATMWRTAMQPCVISEIVDWFWIFVLIQIWVAMLQKRWKPSATMVEAISHYGGSRQPLWWKPSATMVESVSDHGGSRQPPWWKPSATMVEYVSHHVENRYATLCHLR